MKVSSGVKRRCTFGELIECFDNKRIPLSAQERATRKGPYRYYGAQNVVDHIDAYLFDGEYALIAEDGENLRSQKQDVAQIVEGQFWVNNHAHIIQANANADLWYLCALLNQTDISRYISGSAQPKLSQEGMRKIVVEVPDVQEQRRIGLLLRSLDRKIALNRRKIATLEKMAKEIYDYWFVQYDFPDANGRPYKSSGGEMVYSPELKREIPKGWKVEQLGGHLSQVEERVQSVGDDEDFYAPIEVLPRKEMSFSIGAPIENAVSGLCRFRARDILISNRRVYFHKVCVAPRNGLTRDTVFVIRSKKSMSLAEMYQRVNSDEFISYATQSSYGSLQPVLPFGAIKTYRYAQPPEALSVAYNGIANPIVENVLALHLDTDRLSTLRDWLLPLLMNGQVKVGE